MGIIFDIDCLGWLCFVQIATNNLLSHINFIDIVNAIQLIEM